MHVVNEFVLDYAYGAGLYGTNLIESLREGGQKILREAEAYVRQQGVPTDSVLLEAIGGPAADLIVAQAREWHAELIVMGTHGRRGLRRLALGSDAENGGPRGTRAGAAGAPRAEGRKVLGGGAGCAGGIGGLIEVRPSKPGSVVRGGH